jgi:hypothetical protein
LDFYIKGLENMRFSCNFVTGKHLIRKNMETIQLNLTQKQFVNLFDTMSEKQRLSIYYKLRDSLFLNRFEQLLRSLKTEELSMEDITNEVETVRRRRSGIFGTLHLQLLTDATGARLVALPQQEFESILEDIEDWEDTLLLAQAKANDTGERIPMEEVFDRIEADRKS